MQFVPQEDQPQIRALPLFRGMTEAHFHSLMSVCHSHEFPAGLEIIRQGDPAAFLHVVREGGVELYSEWNGSRATMAVVRPSGAFILAACIRDQPYLLSARTLEPSRIILVPAAALRESFRKDPAFAEAVIDELAQAFRGMVRHAKGLKLRPSRERVASYLLHQSRLAGDAASFYLPVEKRLLASYLGMTPENLSRAFKALEGHGVKVDGRLVTIHDRKELSDLALPDYLIDGPDPDGTNWGINLAADQARR